MKRNIISVFFNTVSNSNNKAENEGEPEECLPPEAKQIIVASGPLLLTIGFGMIMGYSATLIPQLQDKNSTIVQIDENQASWIASMAALPMAMGCICGGFLIEHLGRKSTHTLISFPIILGWLLLYFANGISMILVGRFLTGFSCGVLSSATGVYIGETSSPNIRGFLLAGIAFSVSTGLFLVHLIGTFTHWQTTALISCVIPVISIGLLLPAPESPAWLVKKGKIEEAEKAFYWCRGYNDDAKKELNILLNKQPKEDDNQENRSLMEVAKDYLIPEFLKPLFIIVVFIVTNQWMGVNAIAFYTVSILKDTLDRSFDEYLGMLLVDFVRVVISIVACGLLKRYGRRPLALISGWGTAVSLLILSCFTYLASIYPKISTHTYIPIIALISYISLIQIGFVPLPWSMIGEVFPLKHRSIGSAISSFMAMMAVFTVVKTAPSMFSNFEPHGAFLVYAIVSIAGSIFVFAYLPETKGKTLDEIEDGFRRKLPKKVVQSKYDNDENFA